MVDARGTWKRVWEETVGFDLAMRIVEKGSDDGEFVRNTDALEQFHSTGIHSWWNQMRFWDQLTQQEEIASTLYVALLILTELRYIYL